MKIIKISIIIGLAILTGLIIVSCERDDICAEATQTTPALSVEFRDVINDDDLKSVRRLRVIAIDENQNAIDTLSLENADPSAVILPLLIGPENTNDNVENIITTRYILEENSDLADDDDEETSSNIVILEISYTNEFVYVSRACGFKSIFRLQPTTGARILPADDEDDQWAVRTVIENELIENENEAKVLILH